MASLELYILYALASCLVALLLRKNRKQLPLPPGPPQHPLLGHLLTFSLDRQDELFPEWADRYGAIFHLQMPGQTMVVVNSLETAVELFDRRGANYSDRPSCTTFELMGFDHNLVLMPYGASFRKHRRMLQERFHFRAVQLYQHIQVRESHALLQRLLTNPTGWRAQLKALSARIVVEIAYGHRIRSDDDMYAQIVDKGIEAVHAATTGISPIDFIPLLQHVPSWIPGCAWLTEPIRYWRPHALAMVDTQFQEAAGSAEPSFSAYHLDRLANAGLEGEDIEVSRVKGAASVVLIGGLETAWSVLQVFVLTMVLFPEVQRKAREEIDSVVGPDRLPAFSDRADLPYVEGVMQEVLRWHPNSPSGVPHRTMHDDIYNGMRIPARSIVIPNISAMSRDSRAYKNPEEFCPERFLPLPAGGGEPPFDAVFGFGRRVCPGRHLAQNTVWIAIASMLATIEFGKSIDHDGRVVEPRVEFLKGGSTSPPLPFQCSVKARSQKAETLIFEQECD